MPALNVGELTALINADDDGMRRGLNDAELRMRGFQRDVEGRLRHLDGRFATVGEQMAAGLREGTGEGRRFSLSLDGLGSMAGRLGGLAASIGGIAAKLGAAVPVAAGLAAAVGNIAPAAGVAATGMFAVVLATNAVKLGMVGVGDAVSAAMDPSKTEEFNEALKKLSPSAQAFAKQVKTLQPEFKKLQQDVQERLFKGLDGTLKAMGKSTLPVLKKGLTDAAGSLNSMAKGVGTAAVTLSKNGTLGRALDGATKGLSNLSRAPGQLVTAFTQVGAAAAPAFDRLTKAAGAGLDRFSQQFTKAFESGAIEKAIDQAIVLIKDLATVLGNVGSIIGSVFGAAQVSGGGFIGVLKEITGALKEAFASPEVQGGLKAIFETMATAARTVAPLLVQALKVIAPVFEQLGPPVQTLIKALGDALGPIIKALGPVLKSAAAAVGALITAISPMLPIIGELVAALLPAVTPLFDALKVVFDALAPVISDLAGTLRDTLMPIMAGLTPIIKIIAESIADQLIFFIGMLSDLLIELSPTLIKLGEIFGDLLVELVPVIEEFAKLSMQLLEDLMPVITPLIELVGELAAMFADELATILKTVVVPALQMIVALLQGDFSGAWEAAKRLVKGAIDTIVRWISEIPGKVWAALSSFAGKLRARADEGGRQMREAISRKVAEAVAKVRELPGKASAALGNLGSKLYNSGQALVRGFINGIKSMISAVGDAAGSVVDKARNFFPFSPAKEGAFSGRGWTLYSGQSLAQGFADGIAARAGLVQTAMGDLMRGAQLPLGGLPMGLAGAGMPGMGLGPQAGAGAPPPQKVIVEFRGPDAVRDLIRDIVRVDGRGSAETTFGR